MKVVLFIPLHKSFYTVPNMQYDVQPDLKNTEAGSRRICLNKYCEERDRWRRKREGMWTKWAAEWRTVSYNHFYKGNKIRMLNFMKTTLCKMTIRILVCIFVRRHGHINIHVMPAMCSFKHCICYLTARAQRDGRYIMQTNINTCRPERHQHLIRLQPTLPGTRSSRPSWTFN